MSRRYIISDEWGGGEVEEVAVMPAFIPHDHVAVARPDCGSVILVHKTALTLIKPPAPPEPKPGCHLLRRSGQPDVPIIGHGNEWTADGEWQSWEEFWESYGGPNVTVISLVPPAVEIELPWFDGKGGLIEVGYNSTSGGVLDNGKSYHPDVAEAKAYALLTAARIVRVWSRSNNTKKE